MTLGRHLILDLQDVDVSKIEDVDYIKQTLEKAADICGATKLHSYFHSFEPKGITGVVLLAESHISIHTFPENKYIAIDVFMCYDLDPTKCEAFLFHSFQPEKVYRKIIERTVNEK